MNCTTDIICTACGVGIFGNFGIVNDWYPPDRLEEVPNPGGIGYSIAGFVDTKKCKEAYEILTERFDLVFQSPVKRNRNSGRMFFFCVFKDKT